MPLLRFLDCFHEFWPLQSVLTARKCQHCTLNGYGGLANLVYISLSIETYVVDRDENFANASPAHRRRIAVHSARFDLWGIRTLHDLQRCARVGNP